jgi:hypothetical protein
MSCSGPASCMRLRQGEKCLQRSAHSFWSYTIDTSVELRAKPCHTISAVYLWCTVFISNSEKKTSIHELRAGSMKRSIVTDCHRITLMIMSDISMVTQFNWFFLSVYTPFYSGKSEQTQSFIETIDALQSILDSYWVILKRNYLTAPVVTTTVRHVIIV